MAAREEALERFRQSSAFAHLRNRGHADALVSSFLEGYDAGIAARDEAYRLRREGDPDTSHEAAERIVPAVEGLRLEVYEVLKAGSHRFTHHEAIERVRAELENEDGRALAESTIRTRIRELTDAGRIVDSGDRVKLPSGRRAVVWELKA